MNRITDTFGQLHNSAALIPYITAGDPSPKLTVQLMHTLVTAGADMIELGIPFSDPGADGPVIQAAHVRALAQGMTLIKTIDIVKQFRVKNTHTPIVLMGYTNPIEVMGYDKFCAACVSAGVDGVLVVDMPLEEGEQLVSKLRQDDIATIFLVAPTTSKERMQVISQHASGYLYYVSLKGVTGSTALNINEVRDKLSEIRHITNLPLAVGFGIHDAESAKRVAAFANGVVIGSALIALIAQYGQDSTTLLQKVSEFISVIKQAMVRELTFT